MQRAGVRGRRPACDRDEVDGHRNKEGRLAGGWKAADVHAVAAHAKAGADTVLALVAEEAKKGSPLAKVAELLLYEA